jgi:deoxyhypusine synthase
MKIEGEFIESLYAALPEETKHYLDIAIEKVVEAKKKGGKIVVVTGSGPNIHEGVTTLIAEFINKGLIDGVTTSSAVVSHEMGGVLDKVKRINIHDVGEEFLDFDKMPRGDIFELTELTDAQWADLKKEMIIDDALVQRCNEKEGTVIIKAAANMAYPMGLRNETFAASIMEIARKNK